MSIKKISVLLLVCCSAFSFSQEKKGDMAISVIASLLPQDGTDNIGLIGKFGLEFFLSSKVSLQGSFFASSNTLINNDNRISINSFGFLPSAQYYFINTKKLNFFGQLGYGFGFDDETRNFGTIKNSALRIYSFGAGANYTIGNKLQLQLIIPYINAKNITVNQTVVSDITVFLGFNFIL